MLMICLLLLKTCMSVEIQIETGFDMKDLGSTKKILGMEIRGDKNEGKLWVSWKKYLENVIKRFNKINAKSVSTPLAAHFKLYARLRPTIDKEMEDMSRVLYASVVDSLINVMVCNRSDISQAVSVVSKYMDNLGKEHWNAVKWISRYLSGTVDFSILF